MLQAWLSIGYIVLLAILVLAFILWRRGGSRSGDRCNRGGDPPLVWMGIRASTIRCRPTLGLKDISVMHPPTDGPNRGSATAHRNQIAENPTTRMAAVAKRSGLLSDAPPRTNAIPHFTAVFTNAAITMAVTAT